MYYTIQFTTFLCIFRYPREYNLYLYLYYYQFNKPKTIIYYIYYIYYKIFNFDNIIKELLL